MKLWFFRHGESVANLEKIFSNQQVDHPLTPKGILQTQKAAAALQGIFFEKIFSSPIPRAVESATIFSKKLDAPFEVIETLREFSVGILEGRSDEQAWQMFTELWKNWIDLRNHEYKLEGGENLLKIHQRVEGFLSEIQTVYGTQPINILAVSHGGLLHASLPFLCENLNVDYCLNHPLSNTDRVVLEWLNPRWVCLEWAGVTL